MKAKLFVLLVVFFGSVGIVSAQDPCTSQPGCNWDYNVPPGVPPSCVCDELFIDGYNLYIALLSGIALAFYSYTKKHKLLKNL